VVISSFDSFPAVIESQAASHLGGALGPLWTRLLVGLLGRAWDRDVATGSAAVFAPQPVSMFASVAGAAATLALAFTAIAVAAVRAGRQPPLALLRGGERATHTFLVLDGVLREYWLLADGTERTKSFAIEGELSGSLADLNSRRPSRSSIDALTPARVVEFERLVGMPIAEFDAAWRDALAAQYPNDRATGYAVGDLRGVAWAELPAPAGR
jgi:hypothetical protein